MSRTGLLAVALISAAVLSYEVLLMRLLSIAGWHHFAYMIISIALLGFGASGSLLALAGKPLVRRFPLAFAAGAGLFAVSAAGCFAAAAALPFNALEIVWQPSELAWLGATYLLLVLPFFFGGGCIGLAFMRHGSLISRIYAYDLVGAGLGALGIVLLLFVVPPVAALRIVAGLGAAAALLAALAAPGAWRSKAPAAAACVAAAGTVLLLPHAWLSPTAHMSQYKGLAMALRVPDAAVVEERSSPLGLLNVVESPTIPFRHAPGLSLVNTVEPPAQLGLFTDGGGMSAITRFAGDLQPLAYLDYTTAALPYHLLEAPQVLVLGAGGGEQVLLALYHRADRIDAVEVDPQAVDLVAHRFAEFAGGLYRRSEVAVHVAEARSFVAGTGRRFDLIQVPLLDSFAAAAAGVQSLHENHTYTVEALAEALAALTPGGMLAITRWLKLPPRDALKLFATATEALERHGVQDPGRHLALVRSWRTTTLLVKPRPFDADQIAAIERFSAARSFDTAYFPGIRREDANRYNILERPFLFEGAQALLGPDRQAYLEAYKFAIAPATDDRPYFFDFFKWKALPELVAMREQGTAAMLDWGYLVLSATLVQAGLLSLLLILLPLWLRRRRFGGQAPRTRFAAYFLALGLAFLFVEIAFIQKLTLFLGNPLYAVAVVLAGFLAFAGLGSAAAPGLSRRLAGQGELPTRPILAAVCAVAVISLGYLLALPPLLGALIAAPDVLKIALALALIAPLAFFMGMPFPLGLAYVAVRDADLVPWAWGINGCASVLSAILATLLAMHLGFTAVVALAAGLYLAAPFALGDGRPARSGGM